jgi:hypothetical protein
MLGMEHAMQPPAPAGPFLGPLGKGGELAARIKDPY